MGKLLVFYIFISAVFLFPQIVSAQKKDRVETFPRLVESSVKNCKNLQLGQVIFYLEPDYPNEAKSARIGGAVEVTIKIDEKGKFLEIEKVAGSRFLQGAASEAAMKVKFSPTTCNSIPVAVSGVVTYNFLSFCRCRRLFYAGKNRRFH